MSKIYPSKIASLKLFAKFAIILFATSVFQWLTIYLFEQSIITYDIWKNNWIHFGLGSVICLVLTVVSFNKEKVFNPLYSLDGVEKSHVETSQTGVQILAFILFGGLWILNPVVMTQSLTNYRYFENTSDLTKEDLSDKGVFIEFKNFSMNYENIIGEYHINNDWNCRSRGGANSPSWVGRVCDDTPNKSNVKITLYKKMTQNFRKLNIPIWMEYHYYMEYNLFAAEVPDNGYWKDELEIIKRKILSEAIVYLKKITTDGRNNFLMTKYNLVTPPNVLANQNVGYLLTPVGQDIRGYNQSGCMIKGHSLHLIKIHALHI